MEMNEELVQKYRNGDIGIEYDGKSFELLNTLWVGDWDINGSAKYYTNNEAYDESYKPKGIYIPIKQFLKKTITRAEAEKLLDVKIID